MFNRDSSSASTSSARLLRLALLATAFAGCVSVESIAPPVPAGHGNAAMLGEGRRIFLGRCTSCHSAEPVGKYTRVRWQEIVGEMAGDANLSAEQERSLRAYLAAVAR